VSFRAPVRTALVVATSLRIATAVPVAAQSDEGAAARRIADIAAVAMDEYALGVADGRVVNRAEYDEAVLFLAEARRAATGLRPAVAASTMQTLDALVAGVEARRAPNELRPLVDSLRARLSAAVGIPLDAAPRGVPSLVSGEAIYREQCAACHGASGRGDGPGAAGLDPPPADLADSSLRSTSPLDFFRKINVGVAGTAMPAFQGLLPEDRRWAVALYTASLRAGEAERRRGAEVLRQGCDSCLPLVSSFEATASLSDDSLAALLAASLGRDPGDSATLAAAAFGRVAAAAEELGFDRRLEVARVVGGARVGLEAAERAARDGDLAGADRQALDAYLVFERIEATVRARDPGAAASVEAAFARVRGAIAGGDVSVVDPAVREAAAALERAAAVFAQRPAPGLLFAQSLLIMIREGFEAILIVGALMAFLVRAGAPERRRDIGFGVLWAVVASLLTAGAFATLFRAAAASQEALEGATMLVAALVLFWVSYWLVSKVEIKKWQAFVASRMDKALMSRRALALAAVAFLAVYREGFETVLFYAALFATANGTAGARASIGGGMLLGAALLAVVYYAMQRYGRRVPLKPFFAVTSALLYLMTFTFAGQGVAELQAAGYLPMTPLDWVPRVPALGIFPTMQTVTAQALLAAALGLALAWVFWLEPRTARSAARS
jgi:high-affinity iron transporter